MYSFLIADDHQITRFGLIATIKSIFNECDIEEAENGEEIFEKLKTKNFDILITDLGMPETDPYRLIDTALLIQPKLRILILSMNKEELYASNYIKKGALGYIEKNSTFKELTKAIQTVLGGLIYMSPNLTKSFVTGKMMNVNNPFSTLSQRELEICLMLCQGKGLTEIAAIMHIGVSTVGTHKTRILKKVGAENLIDLIKKAQLHSLLN